jgi:hypothetical protein
MHAAIIRQKARLCDRRPVVEQDQIECQIEWQTVLMEPVCGLRALACAHVLAGQPA